MAECFIMKEIWVKGRGLSAMCRLCLAKDVTLLDIFYFSTEMRNQLSNIIMWCAPVQIRRCDVLPNFICHLCYTQLKKIHEFQIQIVQSDKTLRRYLQQLNASDKQIKPECFIQKSSEEHLIQKTNHCDVTVKCESIIFYDIFGINKDRKGIAPLNYNLSSKIINKKIPLTFEIKDEPTNDGSLILTECAYETVETLSKSDNDNEIVCEDSKVDISYRTKLSENTLYIIGKDKKSTTEINQENPLKSEIKAELTDEGSLKLTDCADDTAETLFNGDGSETACEDSKVDINYCTKLGENLYIIGKDKNFRSIIKINQENPLKFEIKDELTNVDSLKLIHSFDDTVETLSNIDCNETCSEHSRSNGGHTSENDVAEYLDKIQKGKKIISLNYDKRKKATEKKYHSDTCNKRFSKSFTLKTHLPNDKDKKQYQCDVCKKCFRKTHQLTIHKRKHTGEKPYQCDSCTKRFSEKYNLTLHKRKHTGEKPYQCDICNMCFSRSSNLASHKRTHTDEKLYQCDICKKCFSLATYLNAHKRIHTGEKPYQCDICKKCYGYAKSLNIHKRKHTGERPYQCDVCKKCFSQTTSLKYHKRTHTGEKPYQCDVCSVYFSESGPLINHKRTHTGEKPYQCDVCNKCFKQTSTLNYHKRTHTGEKPYQCDVCSMFFSNSSNLICHKRIHTGEKPYECSICKKNFSHASSLKMHKRTHTGEKPYQCNICKKCFSRSKTLNIHSRIHTGEKPYQCNICDKCFRERTSLNYHKRSHTGEKPYQCDICKKRFSQRKILNRHKCKHTG